MLVLFVQAIVRLLPRALEPIQDGSLGPMVIVAYAAAMLGLGYSEGYRGFQLSFSPRAVVRALYVARNPRPYLVLLAPLMAMGLIHGTRRRLIGSWLLLVGIVVLIALVGMLAQPWRGAVDAGVVVGLGWGTIATLVMFVRALRGTVPDMLAEVPGEEPGRPGPSGEST